MTEDAFYGIYNARWKDPEDVAKTFVPLKHFNKLIKSEHSVLMGPRGCGKTTLLKMLTRRAIREWRTSNRSMLYKEIFNYPNFEAVYIPTDIRWIYETGHITTIETYDQAQRNRLQRILITISILENITDTFETILADYDFVESERIEYEKRFCKRIISAWHLKSTLPSFRDLKATLDQMPLEIRGHINERSKYRMGRYLSSFPPTFYSHAIDAPLFCCKQIAALLPREARPQKWALCFDELELSPEWMRNELLTCLRSVDPSFLLKLTWSPILPSAASIPEPGSDFTPIKLWNSYLSDPFEFCDRLTSDFLREKYPGIRISPRELLGSSFFAAEDTPDLSQYQKGSLIYETIREQSKNDPILQQTLSRYGINPDDPVPSPEQPIREAQLDQFYRKAKPLLLLRREKTRGLSRKRSRKKIFLYAGLEIIYGISEGNPRWLIGLLNELFESVHLKAQGLIRRIPEGIQANIVLATSNRFIALVKTTPIVISNDRSMKAFSLFDLVDSIANMFANSIYGRHFSLDPTGSIQIGGSITEERKAIINRALEKGALIHVGKTEADAPTKIEGERFRLSFMICPKYNLPLRNYRTLRLEPESLRRSTRESLELQNGILKQLVLDFTADENKKY